MAGDTQASHPRPTLGHADEWNRLLPRGPGPGCRLPLPRQTLLEGLPVTTFAMKKGRILLGKEGSGRERIGVV